MRKRTGVIRYSNLLQTNIELLIVEKYLQSFKEKLPYNASNFASIAIRFGKLPKQ